jgi:uncharacterized protein (TIGR02300 family)
MIARSDFTTRPGMKRTLLESDLAKPELGTKRVCPTTGRKFYDLNKDPVISPYSGESYPRASFEPILKGAAARAAANDDDEDGAADTSSASAEFVSLDDADLDDAKETVVEDIEIDDEVVPGDDDDTFLEEEEEGDGDVAGLIDGDLEGDEET